jgi:hypothetical protein
MPRPFLLQVNDSVDYMALDDFLDFIPFFNLIPNMALFTFLWEILSLLTTYVFFADSLEEALSATCSITITCDILLRVFV